MTPSTRLSTPLNQTELQSEHKLHLLLSTQAASANKDSSPPGYKESSHQRGMGARWAHPMADEWVVWRVASSSATSPEIGLSRQQLSQPEAGPRTSGWPIVEARGGEEGLQSRDVNFPSVQWCSDWGCWIRPSGDTAHATVIIPVLAPTAQPRE